MQSLLKIIFICLLLVSCRAKKINETTETKKETETTKIGEVRTDNTIKNIFEVEDEMTIEPLDSLQPMTVNGKVYKNARLRHRNKKVNTNIINDKKEVKTTVKQSKKTASNKIIKKDIRATGFSWWWWLLLLIPIYYIFRKYKQYIFFI
jgi:hypothetical protein